MTAFSPCYNTLSEIYVLGFGYPQTKMCFKKTCFYGAIAEDRNLSSNLPYFLLKLL